MNKYFIYIMLGLCFAACSEHLEYEEDHMPTLVQGTIKYKNSTLEGITVYLAVEDPTGRPLLAGNAVAQTQTDADGNFSLSYPASGMHKYYVIAESALYFSQYHDEPVRTGKAYRNIELELTPKAFTAIRFKNEFPYDTAYNVHIPLAYTEGLHVHNDTLIYITLQPEKNTLVSYSYHKGNASEAIKKEHNLKVGTHDTAFIEIKY